MASGHFWGLFFSWGTIMKLTGVKGAGTPFDQGYDAGLMWGEDLDVDKQNITKISRGTKMQYIAGLRLGQQEHRKRKLQRLVMLDPS